MADLYACGRCGVVQTGGDACANCPGSDLEEVDLGVGEYECSEEGCDETFESQAGLNSHQRVHRD